MKFTIQCLQDLLVIPVFLHSLEVDFQFSQLDPKIFSGVFGEQVLRNSLKVEKVLLNAAFQVVPLSTFVLCIPSFSFFLCATI